MPRTGSGSGRGPSRAQAIWPSPTFWGTVRGSPYITSFLIAAILCMAREAKITNFQYILQATPKNDTMLLLTLTHSSWAARQLWVRIRPKTTNSAKNDQCGRITSQNDLKPTDIDKNDRHRRKHDLHRRKNERSKRLYDRLDVLDLVHEFHLCHQSDVPIRCAGTTWSTWSHAAKTKTETTETTTFTETPKGTPYPVLCRSLFLLTLFLFLLCD